MHLSDPPLALPLTLSLSQVGSALGRSFAVLSGVLMFLVFRPGGLGLQLGFVVGLGFGLRLLSLNPNLSPSPEPSLTLTPL